MRTYLYNKPIRIFTILHWVREFSNTISGKEKCSLIFCTKRERIEKKKQANKIQPNCQNNLQNCWIHIFLQGIIYFYKTEWRIYSSSCVRDKKKGTEL